MNMHYSTLSQKEKNWILLGILEDLSKNGQTEQERTSYTVMLDQLNTNIIHKNN